MIKKQKITKDKKHNKFNSAVKSQALRHNLSAFASSTDSLVTPKTLNLRINLRHLFNFKILIL